MTSPAPSQASTAKLAGLLWGLLAVSLWAGSFILTRLGVKTTLNPFDIIALRFGFAGLVMLPFILRHGFAFRQLGPLGFLLLVAGTGAPYALLTAVGLKFAPAGQAAALNPGFMTAIVAVVGALFFQQRLAILQWSSVAIILIGCLLISGANVASEQGIGHGFFLCAAALWAAYVFVIRGTTLSALQMTAISAVTSMLIYLPIYALFLPHSLASAPWSDIILQATYQGGITTVLGLYAFNRALVLLGPTLGSALSSLIPVITLVMGVLMLGEHPGPSDLIAAFLITAGVAALSLSRKPQSS